jgi:hypothetical protein
MENRVMGSGLVTVKKNEEKLTYILEPGSSEKQEIELLLKKRVN